MHGWKIPHRNQPVLASGPPLDSAKAAVILIHGRGASATDILSLAKELGHSVLSALGGVVTLRRYPGLPHTINPDEIERAKLLLSRLLAEK